jgi:hypothetical protein
MVNFECIKFNVPLTNRKIPFRIVNCYLFWQNVPITKKLSWNGKGYFVVHM